MSSDSEQPVDGPPREPLIIPTEPPDEPIRLTGLLASWSRFFWQALALVAACVLLVVAGTGAAGWYTSRSQFCNSCHIMEPYYQSWLESTHRDVSCIKCHFPPGVGEKVRGKVLGLVQLAKYVTQTQGPRPVAEIPDASCLRSGCHETRLLSGRVDYNGIAFDHAKHFPEDESQTVRNMRLRCTSCHSQIVQGEHMTVTASTCYLCHFRDTHFNEGLGACTRCHQIPDKEYDLGGGVMFHHDLAYEEGVDCASCHADLVRGNGEVPRERCAVCHNREDDLQKIGDSAFLHQTHVSDHKVDCLSCHLTLHHALDPHKIANAAAQCASCHPNQHQEQVALLQGSGARLVAAHPSNMAAARLSCFTCHLEKNVSPIGTVLMKASLATCVGCHAPVEIDGLKAFHEQLKELLTSLEAEHERVVAALPEAELAAADLTTLEQRLADVGHDIRFLRAGNDIHNSHYASELVGKLIDELTAVCTQLDIDPPDLQMPDKPVRAGLSSVDSAAPAEE
ncbi:MAG: NapC/NirT family cytochrome c [Pirellulaceae bacterium]|jgi:nitrate/TMAO reductase-like tetraheme cytochrome c subunit|nr:NapC/NirT family cytochrome c [Pirellulaceae bacterium]